MSDRIASASDSKNYVTESRLEISQILHTLAREAVQVAAGVGGDKFFLTSILKVDEEADHVLIESGVRNPHLARVLAGQQLSCSTRLANIKISFQLDSAVLASHDGQEALLAPLPRELMRLQRREYYRVSPRLRTSVEFLIPIPSNATPVTKNSICST